jgi:hypothetical protein
MADLPKNSADKIRALREMPYQDYLVSPWWRLRRHARLNKADGKCERCRKVVKIADVHHVNYDRKGAERDSDLEVACRDCHRKLHHEESRKQHIGQYEMLAHETIRIDKPTTSDDFKEKFRARLLYFKLAIDHRFDDAMTIVWSKKAVSLVTEARRQQVAAVINTGHDLPPIDKQEALAICRRLGYRFPFKSMPEAYGTGTGVAAIRERAAARLKALICPQCRVRGQAQLSGVQIGWLFCQACKHKWAVTTEGIS